MSLFEAEGKRAYIRRARIRNFRSIGACDVLLGDLTILVGRNGAGKSNFLDAMRFVTDALQTSLDHAIQSRGGIEDVRRQTVGHPRNFAIALEVELPNLSTARYQFEIAAREQGRFAIKNEKLTVVGASKERLGHYEVQDGKLTSKSEDAMPVPTDDRLYLVSVSGIPIFRPTYDALLAMGFYNLNPDAMKELQSPDAGELLHRDGSNIASVIARLTQDKPEVFERIKDYLLTIVPGITDVTREALGPRETLKFRQTVKGAKHPWSFYAASMSDGTMRVLGTLTAVVQLAGRKSPLTLVGIEEPETALHPGASGSLMDALREATAQTQVVVTTHSPDLLDQLRPDKEKLLVVDMYEGNSRIAIPDDASHKAIRDHLYSPGDLLRMDQLQVNESDLERQRQMTFDQLDGGDA